jgi:hypothetical protein
MRVFLRTSALSVRMGAAVPAEQVHQQEGRQQQHPAKGVQHWQMRWLCCLCVLAVVLVHVLQAVAEWSVTLRWYCFLVSTSHMYKFNNTQCHWRINTAVTRRHEAKAPLTDVAVL